MVKSYIFYLAQLILGILKSSGVNVFLVQTDISHMTDFVCLYNYEFGLSLCKIVRSSVILLLPLFQVHY
jgi:hypothetical protein